MTNHKSVEVIKLTISQHEATRLKKLMINDHSSALFKMSSFTFQNICGGSDCRMCQNVRLTSPSIVNRTQGKPNSMYQME